MKPRSSLRAGGTGLSLALLVLAAGAPLSIAEVQSGAALTVVGTRAGQSLRLGDLEIASVQGRVSRPRMLAFPGSKTVLFAWDQYGAGAPLTGYALSLDGGRSVAQVASTENLVRLRYASFDPLAGEPNIPAELRASPDNQLYLVQFIATPLEEMRAQVRARGGIVYRFLTDNTHIVRLSPEARAQVAAMPFVRWVGAYHPAYRLDETLRERLVNGDNPGEARYSIETMRAGPAEQQALSDLIVKRGGVVHVTTPDQYRMEATLDRATLLSILARNEVSFVDPWGGPGGPDMNLVRQMGGAVPLLSGLPSPITGQGVRGEVFDTGVVPNHQQWGGQTPLTHVATAVDSHGNACYGINFATGTGNAQATGMNPNREQGIFCVYTTASQFGGTNTRLNMNTQAVDPAGPYKSCYQTSSVGNNQTTSYTTISAEVDDYLFRVDYLSCQSQSNTGDRNSRPQAWAKNIVSVGGMELNETLARNDDTWASGASIGPASDLRVKPDLSHSFSNVFTTYSTSATGYGQFSGTSGATPITAGHFGLFMQLWHAGVFPGFGGGATVFADRPKSTTAKALMINGAYRYGPPPASGSTNITQRCNVGWGMADLTKLYTDRVKYFIVNANDPLTNGVTRTHTLGVGPGEPELRITMVYPDPMGSTAAAQQRINDLSLKVTAPNGTVYWGNSGMVPTATSGAGQTAGANWTTSGGASGNTYDTVENVFIQNPVQGSWTVQVIASQIVQDGYLATPGVDAVYSLVASNVLTSPLLITVPAGLPALVPPGEAIVIDIDISPASQTLVVGSERVWYRFGTTGAFTSATLTSLGGTRFRATIPATTCTSPPQFYFTATGNQGGNASSPPGAPATFHTAQVGVRTFTPVLADSFETGFGNWSFDDLWHITNLCPPGGSCDGSQWAYFGRDDTCTYEVPSTAHGGTLTSPVLVLPTVQSGESITLTYCSAKQTEGLAGFDTATVLVNGETIIDPPPSDPPEAAPSVPDSASWVTRSVDLTSYAGQTVLLTWKFQTVDEFNNAFRGWHVDNVRVIASSVACTNPPSQCYANCDSSLAVPFLNVGDFTCFLQKFAASDSYANCDGSTLPPALNVADFTCFLQKFAAGCSAP